MIIKHIKPIKDKYFVFKRFLKKLEGLKDTDGYLTGIVFINCTVYDIPENVESISAYTEYDGKLFGIPLGEGSFVKDCSFVYK